MISHYYTTIFIAGFGGNVVRENVKLHSEWFITNFDELINCL